MNMKLSSLLKIFSIISLLQFSACSSSAELTNTTPSGNTTTQKEKYVREKEPESYFKENKLQYRDKSYNKNIQTIQLYKNDDQLPILFFLWVVMNNFNCILMI